MTKPRVKWAVDKGVYSRILLMELYATVVFLKSNFAISDRSHNLIAFDLVISVLATYIKAIT